MLRRCNTETQKWFRLPYVRSKKIVWRTRIAAPYSLHAADVTKGLP